MSLILAYALKFKMVQISSLFMTNPFGNFYSHAQVEPYLDGLWVLNLALISAMLVCQLYRPSTGFMPELNELGKTVFAVALAVVGLIVINFFVSVIPESRTVMLYFFAVGSVLLGITRVIILRLERLCYARRLGGRPTIVVGTSDLSQDLAERIQQHPSYGYQYLGFVDDAPPDTIHFHLKKTFKILGHMDALESLCQSLQVKALFMTKQDMSGLEYRKLMAFCNAHHIQLNILSESTINFPFVEWSEVDGLPLISTKLSQRNGVQMLIKKWMDKVISFAILLISFPVLVSIAAWIKYVSPQGPVFYRQERVGCDGRVFRIFKFRSMVPNAEKVTGPVMVDESGDSRYISGGGFLRAWSLDELPQFINVLMGDMSIVGPRPERPHFVEQFSRDIPFFKERHCVPVGITGWAQINGRSVLTRRPEHKLKYDIYYINRWSLLFDIKIMLKTVAVVFSRQESY